jgi:tRNA (cytidine/uridine-2'-O-)-methyltransferase
MNTKNNQSASFEMAAYQPDIALNVGALMRLSVGFELLLHIIEPCGFVWDERKIRSSALDYFHHVKLMRHLSFDQFQIYCRENRKRLVLLTTKSSTPHWDFKFQPSDILMVGRESAGVPDSVHNSVDARVVIPMSPNIRSFNVAMSAAIVVSEAARQMSKSL